jgi:hypothetical protein
LKSHFDWFSTWVNEHVSLTLTVVSVPHLHRVLTAFGSTEFDRGSLSLRAAYDIEEPTVRLGEVDGWTYAVEHQSTTASNPAFLQDMTSDGALAVALVFTPNINTVLVARDGEYLAGFEPDSPDFMRWGSTPHAFDAQIEAAGFRHEEYQPPGAACASFMQLLAGVELTPMMLEDRLPCATLPVTS